MLNSIMENNTLFYAITALTVLGTVWMLMVNAFFGRTIRDMNRMEAPKGKWMKAFVKSYQVREMKNQKIQNAEAFIRTQLNRGKSFGVFIYQLKRWSGYCGLACIILMGVGLYGTYLYKYSQSVRYQYLLAGVLSSLVLLLLRPFLCFGQKEDMILDGLTDYMENRSEASGKQEAVLAIQPVTPAAQQEDKDSLAAQVTEGIRQTAASSSRFSHLLTPEEEDIMREVIKEYLT